MHGETMKLINADISWRR